MLVSSGQKEFEQVVFGNITLGTLCGESGCLEDRGEDGKLQEQSSVLPRLGQLNWLSNGNAELFCSSRQTAVLGMRPIDVTGLQGLESCEFEFRCDKMNCTFNMCGVRDKPR